MNWDLIKIKNLSFAKDPVERMKKNYKLGENIWKLHFQQRTY